MFLLFPGLGQQTIFIFAYLSLAKAVDSSFDKCLDRFQTWHGNIFVFFSLVFLIYILECLNFVGTENLIIESLVENKS